MSRMLKSCANFNENRTSTFREITTSVTHEPTNQQTRPITIHPGGGNKPTGSSQWRISGNLKGGAQAQEPPEADWSECFVLM